MILSGGQTEELEQSYYARSGASTSVERMMKFRGLVRESGK
jgi:hypothetical protein